MKKAKVIKRIIFTIITIGIVYALVVFCLIMSGVRSKPDKNAETMLILGAQVRGTSEEDVYPSPVLKERLNAALSYLKENKHTKVIVCGGKGADEPTSEAVGMAKYLKENGIEAERIVLEDKSVSTKQNIANAKKLITSGKTVIVSNDFHIYRAKMLAKRLGIKNISGLPAKSKTKVTGQMYCREVFALGYEIIFDSDKLV
jgi:uncharacterized SAM-binding protein YcdF (DUF218 family)